MALSPASLWGSARPRVCCRHDRRRRGRLAVRPFYVWVGAEAWYFLGYRGAIGCTAVRDPARRLVGLTFGTSERDGVAWWLLHGRQPLAASVMSAALRIRSDRLIARLSAAASLDELTGVLNRRGHEQALAA